MKLYNTMTGRKEDFTPQADGKVKFYLCGATVYNFTHIGNARPAVCFDAARRYLTYKGYDVTFVSNFTDVDDKIIAAANAEGVSAAEIAEKYIREYHVDMDGLNVLRPTFAPRVTEVMPDIIAMIQTLIDKGHAYEVDGTVFFDAARSADYGKLSHKNPDDLIAGARVEADGRKRSPQDFVLWKPAKPGEPLWDSPWGGGRPGWHIECSVMAKKFLGDTIDIHAGGEDLIFPHHENEIAQSEAANGAEFCRCWLHNGMIQVDHQKMAKSKGNFFTTRELAEKFGYDTLRFYILSAHYRMPLNFGDELLQAAQNGLARITRCAAMLDENSRESGETAEDSVIEQAGGFVAAFEAAMEDDLNTANAVTAIFDFVKFANTHAQPGAVSAELLKRLTLMTDTLGILTAKDAKSAKRADAAEIERLISERQAARAAKDWGLSDNIRDALAALNVTVKDTPDGVKWSYNG